MAALKNSVGGKAANDEDDKPAKKSSAKKGSAKKAAPKKETAHKARKRA